MSGIFPDRGFVLVNALILIAALSAVAVATLEDRRSARETLVLSRDAAEADLLSDAGLLFAADLLARDELAGDVDSGDEPWALDRFPVEVGEHLVEVTTRDLSGLFNLNLLRGPDHEAAEDMLLALAELAGLDAGLVLARVPKGVVQEAGDDPHLFGVGDLAHLSDVSASKDDLRDLGTFLAALPLAQPINVNTASAPIVAAISGLDETQAERLVADRRQTPFDTVSDFADAVSRIAGAPKSVPEDLLTIRSSWFLVETRTSVGGVTRHVATVLARDPETGDVRTFMKAPWDAADE